MSTQPKHRRFSLLRIVIVLAVAAPITIGILAYAKAPGLARHLTSRLFHSIIPPKPVQLCDVVENVAASSWTAVPLQLPYSGTLTIELNVVSGNPVTVKLIHSSDLLNFKNDRKTLDYPEFSAQDTRNYRRSNNLGESAYYLIVKDTSLGVLSSKASDIQIRASLSPSTTL
jgi:hypothetical protein